MIADTAPSARPSHDRDWVLALVGVAVILVCALGLARGTRARAGSDAPAIATLAASTAQIRRRPAGSLVWEDVGAGAALWEGDSLFIPPRAAARVSFGDGSSLEVDENSLVVLERPAELARSGQVDLKKGSLHGAAAERELAIRSQGGVTSLSVGSEARVDLREDQARIDVFAGRAVVEARGGRRELKDGQAASLSEAGGLAEAAPPRAELLNPRRGARIFFRGSSPEIPLRWSPAGLEPGDRLQVARDRGFGFVVHESPAASGEWLLVRAGQGLLWWRLVDSAGKPISEARRFTLVEDLPPTLLSPRPRETVWATPGRPALFEWTESSGAGRYRLELSASPGFATVAHGAVTAAPRLWLAPELPEGNYHWRVRAEDEERGESPWSRTGAFRLIHKPLPAAPELMRPEIELEGAREPE